jgi:hypothetical protein
MRLIESLDILAVGGPGSGCNPTAAKKKGNKCGRPPKGKFKTVGKPKHMEEMGKAAKEIYSIAPWVRRLDKKLLRLGGVIVDHITSGADVEGLEHNFMYKFGSLFNRRGIRRVKGMRHECHMNVCSLVKKDKSVQSATGYALHSDGTWNRHSWGVDSKGKIIETTSPIRKAYYGYKEDSKFRTWLARQEDKI